MSEEREDEDGGGANAPFDENPPVDPGQAQVGNSKARFFTPREEESGDEGDEHDEAAAEQEGSTEEGEGAKADE